MYDGAPPDHVAVNITALPTLIVFGSTGFDVNDGVESAGLTANVAE